MSKSSSKQPLTQTIVKDWFLPAIEAVGSVEHSLEAVLHELRVRSAFVTAVKYALVSPNSSSPDLLTLLSQKIKILSQTLEFRLGILAPDRPQAWYRPPAMTNTGPFAATLLNEPIFSVEDVWDTEQLRRDLVQSWTTKSYKFIPLLGDGPSVWRTLLCLNRDHEAICSLPEPYNHLRLDTLPDGLSDILESRPLRAFLLNVRQEIQNARVKLDDCYNRLLSSSESFWEEQKKRSTRQKEGSRTFKRSGAEDKGRNTGDQNQRRNRRENRSIFLAPADYEALSYMGFTELPSHSELRSRYITLAKKLHPDRQAGKDEGFKLLSCAYERLLGRVQI